MTRTMSSSRGKYYEDTAFHDGSTRSTGGHGHDRRPHAARAEPMPNVFERRSLLGPGPVKLTPSWEEKTNLSNDEMNFKHLTLEDYMSDNKPPKDRCNLVYLILLLHGVGTTLVPWNMFITAEQYFVEHKFNVTATTAAASESSMTQTTLTFPLAEEYRRHFLSYLGLAAQIPNVVFSCLNLFIQIGGDQSNRIVVSIVVEVLVVIGTIVLAMIDSSTWPGIFFWITMASVVILNMANGVYQNCVYGMAARLPMKYCNSVVLGSNMGGTVTAVLLILSIAGSPNIRTAAIYYFIAALFVVLACFDTYFALPLLRFYRFHERQAERELVRASGSRSRTIPYCAIFMKTFPQLFSVWLVFFVTLSVFPVVLVDIDMFDPDFFTTEKYFTPVTCFLFFYMSAMMGNLFSFFVRWPGASWSTLFVVFRLVFIPYFAFCNYNPHGGRTLPIVFYDDWAYCGMTLVFGWTSGYFSSLAMMYAPRCVEREHAKIAGMMAAASLCLGLFCGISFSRLFPWFVQNFTLDI